MAPLGQLPRFSSSPAFKRHVLRHDFGGFNGDQTVGLSSGAQRFADYVISFRRYARRSELTIPIGADGTYGATGREQSVI
jgi:hypothetical protein